MDHKVGLDTMRSTAFIENKCLLDANDIVGAPGLDVPVLSSGFPEAMIGCPIRPCTLYILVITSTEEKPLLII